MYYSEEEIKKLNRKQLGDRLFDQQDYGLGQIEELEKTVTTLRLAVYYLCEKLNLTSEELHALHNGWLPDQRNSSTISTATATATDSDSDNI